ncbi:MAG: DEAD/DEAH box helicase, partial [Propionibacteriales bacterium]
MPCRFWLRSHRISEPGSPMSRSRPKSHKADGTPKRRWTAAERAAKGRKPRKSAGKPRSGKRRDDRLKESQNSHSRRVRQRDSWHKEWLEESSNSSSPRGPEHDARHDGSARRRTDEAPKGKRAKSPRRWEESRSERRQRERSPQKRRFADKGSHGRGRQQDGYRTHSHSAARGEHSHLRGSRQHPERQPQQPDLMAWEPTAAMPPRTVVAEGPPFASFDLPQPLVSELNRMGIKTAFPIQAATIADALAGRDILGRARTGSGKTLGFGLPLLASLAASGRGSRLPRAVILAPTRELAMQVANVLAPLAKSLGLRVTLVAGGMSYGPQLRAFERGVDVVVATPGRLIDLMDQAAVDLS